MCKFVYWHFIISQHWDGAGNWNPSLWKTKRSLSGIFNTIIADSLAVQGSRDSAAVHDPSAAMVLTVCRKLSHFSARSVNSLNPGKAMWCHGTWSTLVQVMACCLIALSHYMNQGWLLKDGVNYMELLCFENYTWMIATSSPGADKLVFACFVPDCLLMGSHGWTHHVSSVSHLHCHGRGSWPVHWHLCGWCVGGSVLPWGGGIAQSREPRWLADWTQRAHRQIRILSWDVCGVWDTWTAAGSTATTACGAAPSARGKEWGTWGQRFGLLWISIRSVRQEIIGTHWGLGTNLDVIKSLRSGVTLCFQFISASASASASAATAMTSASHVKTVSARS